MYPKLYELIEQAIQNGVPPHLISDGLINAGWPEDMVHEALESWLLAHGKVQKNTAFKDWIGKYYKKAVPAIAIVVVINVIAVGINLLKPWPTKILADSAFGSVPAPGPLEPYTGTTTLILFTSLMTLSLFIFGTLFGVVRDFVLLKIGFWLNKSIKQESMRHIMHLPLFHQERLSKGDYVYRQNVVTNSLSDLVLGTTSSIVESIIVIVGVLAIMILLNAQLTLIAVVLIPFLFVTMKIIGPKLGRTAQELTEVASETSSRINESVDNAETVQAFTLEDKLLNRITKLWDKGYQLSKRNMLWGEVLSGTNGLLIVIATSLVMYLGGSAALRGELLLGELLIFMTYMGYLLSPVENLIEQITSRNQKIIDVNRIYEVLADHEGIEYLRKDQPMPTQITGKLEFQDITYSYKDNVVFNSLNLTIEPGQKAAIIGPSGGGKSTILKLLPLFLEPDAGKILIDGVDIQTVSLQGLRQKISWVSQSPQLFEGTIIDNLTDGDAYREVSNEEIMDAIETANVTEFASKLPMGLASPAGENGSSLSGGQRQRISIARALVKDAPFVCLDEPTAALDAKSENLIRDSLMQMIEGKTVLMVTHRKSLLALMDIIYVLDEGKLQNVDELGGLDAYLAKLEGIEQEKEKQEAEEAIKKSKDIDVSKLLQEYISQGKLDPSVNQFKPEATVEITNTQATIRLDHPADKPKPTQTVTPTNQSPAKPWSPESTESVQQQTPTQEVSQQLTPEQEVKTLDQLQNEVQKPQDSSLEQTSTETIQRAPMPGQYPSVNPTDNEQDVTIELH